MSTVDTTSAPKKRRDSSCFPMKTTSAASLDDASDQETAVMLEKTPPTPDLQQALNNNTSYHMNNHQKRQYSFPKRTALNIEFSDIRYTVSEMQRRRTDSASAFFRSLMPKPKDILHGISGEFRAGELTAIMGPSGAGKSTLLNILAGYTIRGSSGTVRVNGRVRNSSDNFTTMSAYIMQDDELRKKLTVMESMSITAHLKLGSSTTKQQRQLQIEELLEMLGLSQCQQTLTGMLSGGQKKRLSVALELISNPPVIFLDEPTTGLDSSSCSQCISLLKLLAQGGRTIICTIHQPSALLFEMFDHLYALAAGRCIYQGTIPGLIPFLADLGLNCPPFHNSADYLLEVAVGEYGADVGAMAWAATGKRYGALPSPETKIEETRKTGIELNVLKLPDQTVEQPVEVFPEQEEIDFNPRLGIPWWKQFVLLYYRSLLLFSRDWYRVAISIAAHLLLGYLFGYMYHNSGDDATLMFGNYVQIYGTCLFLAYTGKMSMLLSFPLEYKLLMREYFNHWYSLMPYIMNFLLVEVPMQVVACFSFLFVVYYMTAQPFEAFRIVPYFSLVIALSLASQAMGILIGVVMPIKVAVFVGPVITVLLSMFGFNLFYTHIPIYIRWLYHISYFRAAFQGCLQTVLGQNRTMLTCPGKEVYCHFQAPQVFLAYMDVGSVNIYENLYLIVGIGLGLYISSVIAIWYKMNRR